jgi:hypothetical protein
MNQFSPDTMGALLNFIRKFMEMFDSKGQSPVSMTQAINGKNIEEVFVIFF